MSWTGCHDRTINKAGQNITDMSFRIGTIQICTEIPGYMSVHEINNARQKGRHLQVLTGYIINSWPLTNDEVRQDMQPCQRFCNYLAVIDGKVLEGRRTVITTSL